MQTEADSNKVQATQSTMLAKAGLGPSSAQPPPAPGSGAASGSGGAGAAAAAGAPAPPQAIAPTTQAAQAQIAPQAAPLTLGAAGLGAQPPQGGGPPGNAGGAQPGAELTLCKQLVIQLESRLRFLEAILLLKIIIPTTFPPYQAALATLRNYQAAASAAPFTHGYGPPHPHMFLFFLQSLVLMTIPLSSDAGLKGRMLALLLLVVQMQTMSSEEVVDQFIPYFTVHEMTAPGFQGKAMVTLHARGTLDIPTGIDVDTLSATVIAAINARDFTAVHAEISRSFSIQDGVPYAAQRGLELQRILNSVLCSLGGTRPVGRAPPGGPARKLKGRRT